MEEKLKEFVRLLFNGNAQTISVFLKRENIYFATCDKSKIKEVWQGNGINVSDCF